MESGEGKAVEAEVEKDSVTIPQRVLLAFSSNLGQQNTSMKECNWSEGTEDDGLE